MNTYDKTKKKISTGFFYGFRGIIVLKQIFCSLPNLFSGFCLPLSFAGGNLCWCLAASRLKKVKVSYSLEVERVVGGLEAHCRHMNGGAHPSPFAPFATLSFPDSKQVPIYCWVDRESFLVIKWPCLSLNSWPSGNWVAVTTQPITSLS